MPVALQSSTTRRPPATMTLPPTQATPPTDRSSLLICSARVILQESPINSSRQFVSYCAVATVPKMTVRTALSMHPRMDMDLAVTDHPALAGLISYASTMGMDGMALSGMVWVRPDVANRGKKQICLHGQI
ncbi:hypothetical protein FALCPG4_000395 [Fusarium falciforme]